MKGSVENCVLKGQMKKKIHFEMITKDKSELSSDIYNVTAHPQIAEWQSAVARDERMWGLGRGSFGEESLYKTVDKIFIALSAYIYIHL